MDFTSISGPKLAYFTSPFSSLHSRLSKGNWLPRMSSSFAQFQVTNLLKSSHTLAPKIRFPLPKVFLVSFPTITGPLVKIGHQIFLGSWVVS